MGYFKKDIEFGERLRARAVAIVSRDAGAIFCGLSTVLGRSYVKRFSSMHSVLSCRLVVCMCETARAHAYVASCRSRTSYAKGLIALAHPSVQEQISHARQPDPCIGTALSRRGCQGVQYRIKLGAAVSLFQAHDTTVMAKE